METVLNYFAIGRSYRSNIKKEEVKMDIEAVESHFELGISYLLINNKRFALEEYRILKELAPRIANEMVQRWNMKTD